MKKLYKNTFLFLLPVILLLVTLPVDRRLKFKGLKGDCLNHGSWMYDRIFENEKPIDIAFIGSSHTISGVNDELIESELKDKKINITNLGYCRLGRNLNYILLKELLIAKNPKHLFIEVREDEDRYSHPIFPFLASSKDVFLPEPFFNRDIFDDLSTHLSYKVALTQDYLFTVEKNQQINKKDFGFGTDDDTTAIALMNEVKLKRAIPKPAAGKIERDFYQKFPRSYLKKINQICQENKIQLSFLFLPSYGTYLEKPKEYNTYLNYGKVFLPPQKIFDNPDYWYDTNHLNPAGAKALSLWLTQEIRKEI